MTDPSSPPADLIVRGAGIYSLDEAGSVLRAFAVADGVIVATSATDDLGALAGPETEMVELSDTVTVMPGLGDIHTHTYITGHTRLAGLQVDPSWSVDRVIDEIEKRSAEAGEGEWIIGGYLELNQLEALGEPGMLARVDAVSGGHPLLVRDTSIHARYVNSAALKIMGVDADYAASHPTDVPVDAAREPTGVLYEHAAGWVEVVAEQDSQNSADFHRACVAEGIRVLNSLGVTHFQDASSGLHLIRGAAELDDLGELNAWVTTSSAINDRVTGPWPQGIELLAAIDGYSRPRVQQKFAKIFADGTPFSATAAVHDAYLPTEEFGADWHGEATMTAEEMRSWFSELADRGMGAKVHVAGDRAASMALDALEEIQESGKSMSLQLAHGALLQREDYDRAGRLGVVMDASPGLWYPSEFTINMWDGMPEGTAQLSCCWRFAIDAGSLIAGGTDIPCAGIPNHWVLIETLITRKNPDGLYPGPMLPEQVLTRDEAIAAFTKNVAIATGVFDRTGSLEVGKQADFIVVDQDPFTVDVEDIGETTVVETWFNGRKVYDSR